MRLLLDLIVAFLMDVMVSRNGVYCASSFMWDKDTAYLSHFILAQAPRHVALVFEHQQTRAH